MQKSLLPFFILLFTSYLYGSSSIGNNDPELNSSYCIGSNGGAIKYVVSGRPAPYNFSWRELGSTSDIGTASLTNDTDSINITSLDIALDYVVIIMDDMSTVLCQDTFRFDNMSLNVTVTQNSSSMCTASATAQVFIDADLVPNPSDSQYTFLWNNGETTQTASGLSTGPATVLVTSPIGCSTEAGLTISGPTDPLTISNPVITTPVCAGGTDGTISIDISGGNPSSGAFPYVIQWSTNLSDLNRNPLDNTVNPIPAGIYGVTVTDTDGCQVIESFSINEPAPVSIDGFTNINQSSCSQGACDGRAEVLISGGSNPGAGYDITWTTGETTSTATMLCAGNNVVEVSNAGCPSITDTVEITSPNVVSVVVVDSSNARCFQQNDGEINVTGNGGTPGYSYSWTDNATIAGGTRNNLTANTYTVIAMDLNGCTSDPRSITITEPDSMEVVVELGGTLNPRCNGDNNGILSTRWIRGGNMDSTPTYTWSSNTPNPPNEPTATGLSAGTYSVTVTDGNGCQDETSYTMTTPPPLIGRMTTPADPNCFGELTSITVDTAVGGTGTSFTFSVNNGPQQQLRNPNEVLAGTLIVSVFDRNACRWDTTVVINQPDEVTVDIVDEVTIDLGDSLLLEPNVPASIMIDSIIWTPQGDLTCIDCLTPWVKPTKSATYQVTVIDQNGCRGNDLIKVNLNRARNVYVPNAFSPNGDGVNDFFQMATGTGVNRINYLRIFDRWGQLIYQQENYLPSGGTDGWNGEYRGRDLSMDTYVFVSEVLFQDNTTLIYRGSLNLVR